MAVREPASDSFAVTTCEVAIAAGTRSVVVAGKKLKLSSGRVNRIVVIGDTGCRLKGDMVQDCNDPKKWPFQLVSDHAADKHPDLVIHVGDYYYRETPCPGGRGGCQGSPYGDGWESWRADFFEPTQRLLREAPWVFARGNHEQCGRGSDGWFRFLDAGDKPLHCPATSAAFTVGLDGLKLVVIDSADINDMASSAIREAKYEEQIPAGVSSSDHVWLLTHKPLWAFELTKAGSTRTAAASGPIDAAPPQTGAGKMDGVDVVLAGHVHFFAAIDFSDSGKSSRPAQLVVGDGGSALDQADTRSGRQEIDGLAASYTVKDTFGYLLLERKKQGWEGILYGTDDSVLTTCEQEGRQITCGGPAKQ